MSKGYTAHGLRKWRRLLLVRDSRTVYRATAQDGSTKEIRMGICVLCGPNIFYRSGMLQAHHVKPKSLYPERALLLNNGVMICAGHHQGIVHNHNAAQDIKNTDHFSGWLNFNEFFTRWNSLSLNATFNAMNQTRIDGT